MLVFRLTKNSQVTHRLFLLNYNWLVVWNMTGWFSIQLGMSSSQLTNSFFQSGRYTTNQIMFACDVLVQPEVLLVSQVWLRYWKKLIGKWIPEYSWVNPGETQLPSLKFSYFLLKFLFCICCCWINPVLLMKLFCPGDPHLIERDLQFMIILNM